MAQANLVIVRGGGEVATATAQKFFHAGIPVLVLERPWPTALRRTVALCQAAYTGQAQVEDVLCRRVEADAEIKACHKEGAIPLLVDAEGESIARLRPRAVVDATGDVPGRLTHTGMAPITIALAAGPAPAAPVGAVVDTRCGQVQGRVYYAGQEIVPGKPYALPGGQPSYIAAPFAGTLRAIKRMGDVAHIGEAVLLIEQQFVTAPFDGVLRGLLHPGLCVPQGMPVAELDPNLSADVQLLSSAARCVAGGVLEAYLTLKHQLRRKQ